MCGHSDPTARDTAAALPVGLEILFFFLSLLPTDCMHTIFFHALIFKNARTVFLPNVHLEGKIENGTPILPFSPNSSWHCDAAACQVLNNTLDQGQTNERVLLSNRI